MLAALAATAAATAPSWPSAALAAGPNGGAAAPLELGVVPHLSVRRLLAQYLPLREHLDAALGRTVHISTAAGWAAFQRRVADSAYDLVVTAAHLGRLAQLDHGWTPLASLQPDIKGLLVVAAARPLAAVRDLAGRVLALSNPVSLVAIRGLQWLAAQGLERGRDFTTVAAATDDGVGGLLMRGEAVAAMISGGEYRAIDEPVRAQLLVTTTFAEVPGFVVMVSPRLDATEQRRLRELLLRFGEHAPRAQAFFEGSGFVAIREVPPKLMESMDVFVPATRQALAGAG